MSTHYSSDYKLAVVIVKYSKVLKDYLYISKKYKDNLESEKKKPNIEIITMILFT